MMGANPWWPSSFMDVLLLSSVTKATVNKKAMQISACSFTLIYLLYFLIYAMVDPIKDERQHFFLFSSKHEANDIPCSVSKIKEK